MLNADPFCRAYIARLIYRSAWTCADADHQQPQLCQKIVFPLHILPVINLGAAMFQVLVSLAVLLIAVLLLRDNLPLSVAYLPVVLLPFILITIGLAWLLTALGVYLRDMG